MKVALDQGSNPHLNFGTYGEVFSVRYSAGDIIYEYSRDSMHIKSVLESRILIFVTNMPILCCSRDKSRIGGCSSSQLCPPVNLSSTMAAC